MTRIDYIFNGLLLAMVTFFTVGIAYELQHDHVCTDSTVVEDIIQVNYRTVTAKMSNGEVMEVNQPQNLKQGGMWCLEYGMVRK